MRYLLDSSILIDHLRGHRPAVARFNRLFEEGDDLFVNEVVVCELETGATIDPDPALTTLVSPLEFVQPGPDQAHLAGRWRREARLRGRVLSVPDALIAAAAQSLDAAILTRNVRDFALTPVRIETY